MNTKIAILSSGMAAVCALAFAGACHAGVAVVSSASNAEQMDTETVRRVFLGREAHVGGKTAQVVYHRNSPLREAFDRTVLGKPGAELTTYWSRLIFTGKAKAPAEVASDADVKARVTANPGAVGYIADDAVDGSVKVVHKF